MLNVLRARWQQGYRTMRYPDGPAPELPERFVGRPRIESAQCPADCRRCAEVCPTQAIRTGSGGDRLRLDMGRCLFCRACADACPSGALQFSREFRLAASRREDLIVGPQSVLPEVQIAEELRRILGRSLKLRQVSAGGCNACEADTNVLGTVAWDLGRFGIPVRRLATACRWLADHRAGAGKHAAGPGEDVSGGSGAEAGHRRGQLCYLRRPVSRSAGGPQRGVGRRAGRRVRARLPTPIR